MKQINEIIQELDERRLPEDLVQVGDYIHQMETLGVSSSSRISMLVAHSRRKFFAEETGFHKWAKESFGFNANHTSHCSKIGGLLLDSESGTFRKLAVLPFNKLIALSRLTPSQIEGLAFDGKDFIGMTRDEIRDAVREELGESRPEPKPRDPNAESLGAIAKLSALDVAALDSLVKSADAEAAQAMLNAGRQLLAIGLEAAQALNLDGALEKAERLLSIQLNAIRKRQDALKAAKAAPQLETKTA